MSNENAEWRQKILGALRELKADYRREERTAHQKRSDTSADDSGARQAAPAA